MTSNNATASPALLVCRGANHMDLETGVALAQVRPALLRFLHVIFAEHAVAGIERVDDPFRRLRFAHGDQGHLIRIAFDITAGLDDLPPDRIQPFGDGDA